MNTIKAKPVTLLVADDDADDRLMIRDAIRENHMQNDVRFVSDGVELLDYLHQRGAFAAPESCPRPGLILLDLNMPKVDGRAALQEIKSHPILRQVPVVVLTTSKAEEDILRTYHLGVNSFVTKPVTFDALVKVMRDIGNYWFQIVELPFRSEGAERRPLGSGTPR